MLLWHNLPQLSYHSNSRLHSALPPSLKLAAMEASCRLPHTAMIDRRDVPEKASSIAQASLSIAQILIASSYLSGVKSMFATPSC